MATQLYNHASALENANGSSPIFNHQPGARLRNRLLEGTIFAPLAALPVVLDVNVTALAGTNPTVQFIYESTWDGVNWLPVYSTTISTVVDPPPVTLGTGAQLLGPTGRLRWVIGGTVGPSATFTATVTTVN